MWNCDRLWHEWVIERADLPPPMCTSQPWQVKKILSQPKLEICWGGEGSRYWPLKRGCVQKWVPHYSIIFFSKRVELDFSESFFNYKKNCLRPNWKYECLQTQIKCTKNVKKLFGQGKNWKRLQNHNFHQLQNIFAVAGLNHWYIMHSNNSPDIVALHNIYMCHAW